MSPLDQFRHKRYPVFSTIFLDLCGPYVCEAETRFTRQNPVLSGKVWILVVICAASHAAHLELVEGYSTAGFLSAFDNFVSLRGLPTEVFADRGSQVKAAGETMESIWEAVDTAVLANRYCETTEWHFVPAGAHAFIGMAERLVKSVKQSITVCSLSEKPVLTKLHFSRLLYVIANLLNSRPLTVGRNRVSKLDDMRLIRPNDLLLGRSAGDALTWVCPEDFEGSKREFFELLNIQRAILNQFWVQYQNVVFHTLLP